ncbi:MAG: HEAT repeat domain-containing protein [Firmicutes bacterium]|nr:HEAT repeat domain-containing protein [Bacillota bacterium]
MKDFMARIALLPKTQLLIIGAVAVAVLLLAVWLLTRGNKQKGQVKKAMGAPTVASAFGNGDNVRQQMVPVSVGADQLFLSIAERIRSNGNIIDEDTREKISQLGSAALPELVAAYRYAGSELRAELRNIVAEEDLVVRYCEKIGQPEHPAALLGDAWECFGSEQALPAFVELLASPSEEVQLVGVSVLSSIQDTRVLTHLVSAMMQPQRYVPARVAEVFGAYGKPAARLLAQLLPEVRTDTQPIFLATLASIDCDFPLANIIGCLSSDDAKVRTAAATVLGESGKAEALEPLLGAAEDEAWPVRAEAARALGVLGDARAAAVLGKLSEDPDGWVGANAREALGKLGKRGEY